MDKPEEEKKVGEESEILKLIDKYKLTKLKIIEEVLKDTHTGKKLLTKKELDERYDFSAQYDRKKKLNQGRKNVAVYKMLYKNSKEQEVYHALKVWEDIKEFEESNLQSIKNLRDIYYHKHILQYLDVFVTEILFENGLEKLCLVVSMEYCNDNLQNILEKQHNNSLKSNEMELLNMFNQCTSVISYLKETHLTSMFNIKPSNILIENNKNWKFCDFGMSQENQTGMSWGKADKLGAVSNYVAPEVLDKIKNGQADPEKLKFQFEKCDLFSLGMILYEFSQNKKNTLLQEEKKLTNQMLAKKVLPNVDSKFWKAILKIMLDQNCEKRKKVTDLKDEMKKWDLDDNNS